MFTNPYISSELARDRQRFTRANGKQSNRPGMFMIGIAFAAALLAASVVGTAEADAAASPHVAAAPAAEHIAVPATGRRLHQPVSQAAVTLSGYFRPDVQKVRWNPSSSHSALARAAGVPGES
jgi:hypothetical protein